MRNETVAKNCC